MAPRQTPTNPAFREHHATLRCQEDFRLHSILHDQLKRVDQHVASCMNNINKAVDIHMQSLTHLIRTNSRHLQCCMPSRVEKSMTICQPKSLSLQVSPTRYARIPQPIHLSTISMERSAYEPPGFVNDKMDAMDGIKHAERILPTGSPLPLKNIADVMPIELRKRHKNFHCTHAVSHWRPPNTVIKRRNGDGTLDGPSPGMPVIRTPKRFRLRTDPGNMAGKTQFPSYICGSHTSTDTNHHKKPEQMESTDHLSIEVELAGIAMSADGDTTSSGEARLESTDPFRKTIIATNVQQMSIDSKTSDPMNSALRNSSAIQPPKKLQTTAPIPLGAGRSFVLGFIPQIIISDNVPTHYLRAQAQIVTEAMHRWVCPNMPDATILRNRSNGYEPWSTKLENKGRRFFGMTDMSIIPYESERKKQRTESRMENFHGLGLHDSFDWVRYAKVARKQTECHPRLTYFNPVYTPFLRPRRRRDRLDRMRRRLIQSN